MPTDNGRTAEQVRHEIETERERLAVAVDDLRAGIDDATDINKKLRGKLPVAAAAAFGTGFVLAGGIRATMKAALNYRESRRKTGPFSFLSRD
jgi:hypothetical protein